mmetsp:Transcript_25420/g.46754  ORF Transcript_25420/g.46754 Transcript_25420/m.46754 type:complete len:85 (-) Transcript_25420:454-708(-)
MHLRFIGSLLFRQMQSLRLSSEDPLVSHFSNYFMVVDDFAIRHLGLKTHAIVDHDEKCVLPPQMWMPLLYPKRIQRHIPTCANS